MSWNECLYQYHKQHGGQFLAGEEDDGLLVLAWKDRPLVVDLLTGALVVEKIYGINGIGKLMVDAITGQGVDYNYVLALGILYSALYIGIMLVVDLLYGVLDPRIRVSAKEGGS